MTNRWKVIRCKNVISPHEKLDDEVSVEKSTICGCSNTKELIANFPCKSCFGYQLSISDFKVIFSSFVRYAIFCKAITKKSVPLILTIFNVPGKKVRR